MLIPVFVSMPNRLSNKQAAVQQLVFKELGDLGIEARNLGLTASRGSIVSNSALISPLNCSMCLGSSAPNRATCSTVGLLVPPGDVGAPSCSTPSNWWSNEAATLM